MVTGQLETVDKGSGRLTVRLAGPATEEHLLDAGVFAPALAAMAVVLEQAAKAQYGEECDVSIKVDSRFRPGSFEFDLVVAVKEAVPPMLAYLNEKPLVGSLLELWGVLYGTVGQKALAGVYGAYKCLQGRQAELVPSEDKDAPVTLVEAATTIRVHPKAFQLMQREDFRSALEAVQRTAFGRDGIEAVTFIPRGIGTDSLHVDVLPKDVYAPPVREDPVEPEIRTTESRKWLFVDTVAFRKGKGWYFNTGGPTSFAAKMLDEAFESLVGAGKVAFTGGDRLDALVRETQTITGTKARMTYEVLRVYDHASQYNPTQHRLFI